MFGEEVSLGDARVAFTLARQLLLIFDPDRDMQRFRSLCCYLLASVQVTNAQQNYVSVAGDKRHTIAWIHQQRKLLLHCCFYLKQVRPEMTAHHKLRMLCLSMLMTFTNPFALKAPTEVRSALVVLTRNTLKELVAKGLFQSIRHVLKKCLCRSRPCLNQAELAAIVAIATRPVTSCKESHEFLQQFLVHILSVPALTLHLKSCAPDVMQQLMSSCPLNALSDFLVSKGGTDGVFSALDGSLGICLLANFVHMASMDLSSVTCDVLVFSVSVLTDVRLKLTSVTQEAVQNLLHACQRYVSSKQSSSSHWHMILGWFSQEEDQEYATCSADVRTSALMTTVSCKQAARVVAFGSGAAVLPVAAESDRRCDHAARPPECSWKQRQEAKTMPVAVGVA